MDVGESIVYTIILLAFIGLIGLAGYLAYDYLQYKKDLAAKLTTSSKDINFNFDISSSNFDVLDSKLIEQRSLINTNISRITNNSNIISNRITDTSNFVSHTSNLISNRLSNNIDNLNSFDSKLKNFFTFKEYDTNKKEDIIIGTTKLFDYIFGTVDTRQPKIDLIKETTAIGGMTIVSASPGTDFKICNAAGASGKCVNMNTDASGNFNIMPTTADSLTIKNNDQTASVLAKFDTRTAEKAIYLGAADANTAPLYIKSGNVYVKNLNLLSPADNTLMLPLYTTYTINNTNGTSSGKVNTTIVIRIQFQKSYALTANNILYLNIIPHINMENLLKLTLTEYTHTSFESRQDSATNYVIKKLTKDTTDKSDKLTFQKNSLSISIDKTGLTTIEAGYELTLTITVSNVDNITTLSATTANASFVSNSYFGQ
jgi:hypothetical protein